MSAPRDKVIITCAVTGAIHTPTMTPYLPITPAQIAEEAIGAWRAGAAIVHLHARDPGDGRPTPDPKVFMQFLPAIKAETDAVINITTGGGHNMTVQQRLEAPLAAKPEMCSLNMGSMNFGLFHLVPKYPQWKFDWEPQYLENTRDFIFRNTYKDIEFSLRHLARNAVPGSNSSATTSVICTTSRISSTAGSSSRRCSFRPSSASSVASGRRLRTCCTCGAWPTGCSASSTTGRSWAQAATRWGSSRWARSWAAIAASGSRTASTCRRASSRKA